MNPCINLTVGSKLVIVSSTLSAGIRAYDASRYRPSGEPPQPSPQQTPSSQAETYPQVPKTLRVMTLADHISVRSAESGS